MRSTHAPQARTLIDILYATAERYPDAPAIDDGDVQLTYAELIADIQESVAWLAARGIGRGDRIGIRMPSGSYALYVAILATLAAGAAYVPVDADDPESAPHWCSARPAWSAVITEAGLVRGHGLVARLAGRRPADPRRRLDHLHLRLHRHPQGRRGDPPQRRRVRRRRSRDFLQDNPLGPGDRVLAGLSVAFDASCEEMWLAWRHGACLVPAPRSLVRSGMDLGPWLVSRDITVVSTVPTLASLWPAEALEAVRLLIFGGEACPPELGRTAGGRRPRGVEHLRPHRGDRGGLPGARSRRRAGQHRPAAARLGSGRRRQGRPAGRLRRGRRAGDRRRRPGPLPGPGEGRREVRAHADPGLGPGLPQRRPGPAGTRRAVLPGPRRRSGQGRRPPDRARRGRRRAGEPARVSAAVQPRCARPPAALPCWSATSPAPTRSSTWRAARKDLPRHCPPPWCHGWCWSTNCPPAHRERSTATRCRGRSTRATTTTPTWTAPWAGWPGCGATCWPPRWTDRVPTSSPSAAVHCPRRNWCRCCDRSYPQVTVADLYDHPRLGSLAGYLDELDPPPAVETRTVTPVPLRTQLAQVTAGAAAGHPGRHAVGGVAGTAEQRRRETAPAAVGRDRQLVVDAGRLPGVRHPDRPDGHRGALRPGAAVRTQPGTYPRGGSEHLRVWLAERLSEASGAENQSGAPWLVYYARALGNQVGKAVDLHSAPPVTGMLTLGHRCSIEPEVDLTGHWIDGDLFHVGPITHRQRCHHRRPHHPAARRGDRQERRSGTGFRA